MSKVVLSLEHQKIAVVPNSHLNICDHIYNTEQRVTCLERDLHYLITVRNHIITNHGHHDNDIKSDHQKFEEQKYNQWKLRVKQKLENLRWNGDQNLWRLSHLLLLAFTFVMVLVLVHKAVKKFNARLVERRGHQTADLVRNLDDECFSGKKISDDYYHRSMSVETEVTEQKVKRNFTRVRAIKTKKASATSSSQSKLKRVQEKSNDPDSLRLAFQKEPKLSDFEILRVLGQGAYAKVFLVKNKKTGMIHAMKSLRKDEILRYDKLKDVIMEKQILQELQHPYLVGLDYCFQTESRIYFIIPFIRGGELFQHLNRATRFGEDRARRISFQIALALGHLHSKKIVYRDLKPENVLVGEDGYVSIVDFGVSKQFELEEVTKTLCGTPEYLAPEMLRQQGHSYTVDWWALGILTYEMIIGFPPFYVGKLNDQLIKRLRKMILESNPCFPDEYQSAKLNFSISDDCLDFIQMCLVKDPSKRLGSKNGLEDIIGHRWFTGMDRNKYLKKEITIPENERPRLSDDPMDLHYFDDEVTSLSTRESVLHEKVQQFVNKFQDSFTDFD